MLLAAGTRRRSPRREEKGCRARGCSRVPRGASVRGARSNQCNAPWAKCALVARQGRSRAEGGCASRSARVCRRFVHRGHIVAPPGSHPPTPPRSARSPFGPWPPCPVPVVPSVCATPLRPLRAPQDSSAPPGLPRRSRAPTARSPPSWARRREHPVREERSARSLTRATGDRAARGGARMPRGSGRAGRGNAF